MSARTTRKRGGGTSSIHTTKSEIHKACRAKKLHVLDPT